MFFRLCQFFDISIHAPLARCDGSGDTADCGSDTFQSTHLLRGATVKGVSRAIYIKYFNPRTSCEVRQSYRCTITAYINISIHAPLARCDAQSADVMFIASDFNPRTSCEVRLLILIMMVIGKKFQSTHLLRGAT